MDPVLMRVIEEMEANFLGKRKSRRGLHLLRQGSLKRKRSQRTVYDEVDTNMVFLDKTSAPHKTSILAYERILNKRVKQ